MPQLSSGQNASLVLAPGESYTISTTGSATVKGVYGAPSITTTLTANFAKFGPYGVPAKLDIACSDGVASYTLDQFDGVPVTAKNDLVTGGVRNLTAGAGRDALSDLGINSGYTSGASKIFGAGSAGNAIGAGVTVVTQFPAEYDFVGVKFLYQNQSAASITVTKAVAASTPTHQDTGATATWQNVTFSGAASGVVPASPGGASTDIVGGYLLSDFVPCTSVPRTDDVTKMPLVQARSYFAAAGNGTTVGAGDFIAWAAGIAGYGRQFAARTPAGDATATFTATQQPLEVSTWVVPATVIFAYPSTVKTLLVCGDSLSKGHLTTGGATSWPAILTGLLRNTSQKFAVNNASWTGQTQAGSVATAKAIIPAATPNYCAIFGWSPNDGSTQAAFDAGFSRAVDMIEYCRKYGVTPVICTSGPVNGNTAPQNAMRQANNARLVALCVSTGAICLDFAKVIENPSDTSQINPSYSQGDGTHYNDAGHAAMAAFAVAAFK